MYLHDNNVQPCCVQRCQFLVCFPHSCITSISFLVKEITKPRIVGLCVNKIDVGYSPHIHPVTFVRLLNWFPNFSLTNLVYWFPLCYDKMLR